MHVLVLFEALSIYLSLASGVVSGCKMLSQVLRQVRRLSYRPLTQKHLSRRQWTPRRTLHVGTPVMTTPPPMTNTSDISPQRYHQLSDATMDTLLESLEELLDDLGKPEYEVEYSSGVLTLKLGSKGTYVINKQPPNKQIWLSSPFSGPKRYDYVAQNNGWYYSRDGRSMESLLSEELSGALERNIELKF